VDAHQPIDYSAFDALTFDCYGTLIDWEAGLVAALRDALGDGVAEVDPEDLLVRFARYEATAEAGPYQRYRAVLANGLRGVASELDLEVSYHAAARFGGSVVDWPAFPDSAAALAHLKTRFRLGVITNCDDDLFAASNERLGIRFDWVVTAQQVGSYKPSEANFQAMFERLAADGVDRGRILHVAQSLYHDHAPAKQLGMTTVWIDRRHDRPGFGATPRAEAQPDATFPDMRSFAAQAVRG
jgi:2-haloacid dehalogenase